MEIRELYEQIVQAIDGDGAEVEWSVSSFPKPAVRKQSKSHSGLKQGTKIKHTGKQQKDQAAIQHKSVSSVVGSSPFSRRRNHSAGKVISAQTKVKGQRLDERRREADHDEEVTDVDLVQNIGMSVKETTEDVFQSLQAENGQGGAHNAVKKFDENTGERLTPKLLAESAIDEVPCHDVDASGGIASTLYPAENMAEKQRDCLVNTKLTEGSSSSRLLGESPFLCGEVQTDNLEDPVKVGSVEDHNRERGQSCVTDTIDFTVNPPSVSQDSEIRDVPIVTPSGPDEILKDQEEIDNVDHQVDDSECGTGDQLGDLHSEIDGHVKESSPSSEDRQTFNTEKETSISLADGKTWSLDICVLSLFKNSRVKELLVMSLLIGSLIKM